MVVLEKGSLPQAMNARFVGSGDKTMVLAHGFGGDQSLWDKTIASLAQHSRVLLFDWLFSGSVKDQSFFDPLKYHSYDAYADDLINLLDELNVKNSVFVGHSMSGMIGCIGSIKRPDLFERLVLVAASPRYINTEGYNGGFELSDVETIFKTIESDFHGWVTAFAPIAVDSEDSSSTESFEKVLRRMSPQTALELARVVFCSDLRDILGKVSIPCTIVQTANDAVVPRSVAYYMKENIKGKTTVEIIDTRGHFPHLTAPVKLVDVLVGLSAVDA